MTTYYGSNTPESTAELQVDSTSGGVLIPRMTTAQRTAISTPAESLCVFDTDTNSFWWYDDNNTAWVEFASQAIAADLLANTLTLDDGSELTIATGAITITTARHSIDTESDAASDDLDTISGMAAGEFAIVSANNTARTVVLKNGTDNIITTTGSDITLDETYKLVLLVSLDGTNVHASPLFGATGYDTVQDGGTPLTQRGTINFIQGSNVTLTIADDAGNSRTNVTIAASGGGGSALPSTFNARLSLSSSDPVLTSDVTAATTLYLLPYKGETLTLYDGSTQWDEFTLGASGINISIPASTDTNYDIYVYDSTGLTLEAVAWTNDTTRATALVLQDGVYVKTGTTTKRYVGTIRTSGTSGQCEMVFGAEDTTPSFLVWNLYNQVPLHFSISTTTASGAYATNAWRSYLNDSGLRVQFVLGLPEATVQMALRGGGSGGTGNKAVVGIGLDSTSANSAPIVTVGYLSANSMHYSLHAEYHNKPGIGYHYLQCLERASSGASITFIGDDSVTDAHFGAIGAILG